jgi:hypothetical protein
MAPSMASSWSASEFISIFSPFLQIRIEQLAWTFIKSSRGFSRATLAVFYSFFMFAVSAAL